jgi:DNA-binding MarR family transcriptional regulator
MQNHDQIETIISAQRALMRALQEASPSWLDLNVTMAQLKTLIVLNDRGPLHIGQVGGYLGVTLPTASYQVERLVRAGLVERTEDARDRRRTLVTLTPKAQDLIRSLRQGRGEQLRTWLRELSADDLEALEHGLTALSSVLEQRTRETTAEQPLASSQTGTAHGNE